MAFFYRHPKHTRTPEETRARHARAQQLRRAVRGLMKKSHEVQAKTNYPVMSAILVEGQFVTYCSDVGLRFWQPSLGMMLTESHPTPAMYTPQSWPERDEGVYGRFGLTTRESLEESIVQARVNDNSIDVGILSERAKKAVQIRWARHAARARELQSQTATAPPPTDVNAFPAAGSCQQGPLAALPPDPSGNAVATQDTTLDATPSDVFTGLGSAEPNDGESFPDEMSLSENSFASVDRGGSVDRGAEDLPSEALDADRTPHCGARLDPGMMISFSPASLSDDESCSDDPHLDETCSDGLPLDESFSEGPHLDETCSDGPPLDESFSDGPSLDESCSSGSSSSGSIHTTTPAPSLYDNRRLALAPPTEMPSSVPRSGARSGEHVPRVGRGGAVQKVTKRLQKGINRRG